LTIGPNETAGQLHERLALLSREALSETLRQLCAGTLVAEKQNDELSCYAPMMKKEDGLIDWKQTAINIHNQVRGLDPWPGTYTYLAGEILKIAATAVDTTLSGEPGTVLSADKSGVRVACGDGVLVVGELQLPGKKRLTAADFLRGYDLPLGTSLK
jgi:methionyl-tRNA formyltransferase